MRASFADTHDQIPEFYFEDGLRKVTPYTHTFQTYAKERWLGRSILDVFRVDFRDRSAAYYEFAIKAGMIRLNHQTVSPDTIVKNSDLITNVVHRHEPPVIADPVKILHQDESKGLLVVEKPGSMPVHVTGRYRYNTLLEILQREAGFEKVMTCNRLDKLTSGIMVCATTKQAAQDLGEVFATEGQVRKEYIARVLGRFPEEEITCLEPLIAIDRQLGLNAVHPEGRPAKTIFRLLSYHAPSDTSVLLCKPITGRSHQIRVHLQFLGYPIANDPLYNNALAWGRLKAKGGAFKYPSADGRLESAFIQANLEQSKQNKRLPPTDGNLETGASVELNDLVRNAVLTLRDAKDKEDDFARFKDLDFNPNPTRDQLSHVQQTGYCLICGLPLLPDPKPSQMCIWLHAKRYSSEKAGWDFESKELPAWSEAHWPEWKDRMAEIQHLTSVDEILRS